MDSYLMMLYVTLEQESALKQFFLEHGWPYSKPDLSITTDKLGPANCNLVSSPVVLPQPASDKVEPTKSSQVPNTAPDIEPTSIKPGKRKAKPPPRYAVKEKQAKVATKQHSTRTSKQKDTMTYIDIDTAGPSNVFADPSNISAEPSDISADPSNTSSGPSNSAAGPSNIVAGPIKTAAKTVKILSITGLDGEETQVKIEVPDAEYEKESVDQDFDDNDIAYDDDDDDDPDYNENDDDDGDDSDDDYSYKGQGQSVTSNTVKNSKSGADNTTSASKEQSVGTENFKKEVKYSHSHSLIPSKMATPKKRTKKRKNISIHEKIKMIDRVRNGQSRSSVQNEFGVSESTLRGWLDTEAKLRADLSDPTQKRKRLRGAKDKALDQAVMTWFTQARTEGTPISGPNMQDQAKKFHKMLHPESPDSFQASRGWLRNVKRRHGIRQVTIPGEQQSVDEEAAASNPAQLIKLVQTKQEPSD